MCTRFQAKTRHFVGRRQDSQELKQLGSAGPLISQSLAKRSLRPFTAGQFLCTARTTCTSAVSAMTRVFAHRLSPKPFVSNTPQWFPPRNQPTVKRIPNPQKPQAQHNTTCCSWPRSAPGSFAVGRPGRASWLWTVYVLYILLVICHHRQIRRCHTPGHSHARGSRPRSGAKKALLGEGSLLSQTGERKQVNSGVGGAGASATHRTARVRGMRGWRAWAIRGHQWTRVGNIASFGRVSATARR